MRRIPLLILILCSVLATAFSQGEVPVDMYTGQPSITIPIWTLSSGDISQPVFLSYNANAIHAPGNCGLGWSVSAGGAITREARTYPDDIGYTTTTKGWLYKNPSNVSIATDIGNFVPDADNSTVWDAGEGTDHTKINGFGYNIDTEPDIFNYSAPGLSGSFVFDNSGTIRTIPYADVVITPTYTSSNDKKITSFSITTNTGYVFTFGYTVSVTRSAIGPVISFTPAEFEFYDPAVTFTREWKLTRIDSPDGTHVQYTYASSSDTEVFDIQVGQFQELNPFYAYPSELIELTLYKLAENVSQARILSITGSTGASLEFVYRDNLLQTIVARDARRGTTSTERQFKSFSLEYIPVTYMRDNLGNFPVYTTHFLGTVTERQGCEVLPPYTLWYTGIHQLPAVWNKPGYFLSYPDRTDKYGKPYINSNPYRSMYVYPDEPMIDRYRPYQIPGYSGDVYTVSGNGPTKFSQMSGVLESINNPEGGVTTFHFESNDYLEATSGTTQLADGLRIARIEYHDGVNITPIKKIFKYVDSAGVSSGRMVRKPVWVVPTYSWSGKKYSDFSTKEERFKKLFIRSNTDQTNGELTQGNPVGYKTVTVIRPGAGFARFEFSLPASDGDSATGDWTPTTNKFARRSADASVSMGVIDSANSWGFPFTPNPNYDYERGLLLKKSDYSSDSSLVQQTITSYQYLYKSGSTPYKVYGLKYDRFPGFHEGGNEIFFYGRYYLLTDVVKVPQKEIVVRYDLNDSTGNTMQKDSVEYVYGSSYHKLLTQVNRYTVNGDLYTSRIKYPKDYVGTSASGADDAVAIHTMKSNNRHAMPIETVQTFRKAGNDTVWVTGGNVVKLGLFSSVPRVRSVWSLTGTAPFNLEDFGESSVFNSGGYKYRIDSRYRKVDSIMTYSALGTVASEYNPVTRKTSAVGYGYGASVPVVQLANGAPGQAAFSDFDTYVPGFSLSSSTAYYGSGRTGDQAFYPGVTLTDTLTKAGVSNYILSFWIKNNADVSFTVDLKNTSGSALSPAVTTSFTVLNSGGSEFIYVQKIIPVPGHVPSAFRIEFKATGLTTPPSGGSAPGLLPVIDDVFFYPETSRMMASQYEFPFGTASVTTGLGEGGFTEYDQLGRPVLMYDKNRNIVKRNIYHYLSVDPLFADFTADSLSIGSTTDFTAVPNDCVTDATYEWDIGLGFVPGTNVFSHAFDTTGTYTISMRVTSATYGSKTVTRSVTINSSPFDIELCAKGAVTFLSGAPDIIEVCSAISQTPRMNGVILRVTPDGAGPFTYQWKMRDLASSVWVDVGRDSNQYDFQPSSTATDASVEIMCVVTHANGSKGLSPKKQIIFVN